MKTCFSQVLSTFNQFLGGNTLSSNDYPSISNNLEKLPVDASIVWLRAKTSQELTKADQEVIVNIQLNWHSKVSNVLDEKADIYTSNLSIYYATLLEVKNAYLKYDLQKTITEIRDYIFTNMIKKGSIISSIEKGKPDFDTIFSVLPFGLFAPEDLIMVSAIQELVVVDEIDSIKASLLGIYFTEKYDFIKAETYLKKAEQVVTNELDQTLLNILVTYLDQKKSQLSTDVFIHKPFGNGNVYDELPYERKPHYPKSEESFEINVQINLTNIEKVEMLFIESNTVHIGELVNSELNIFRFKGVRDSEHSIEKYSFKAFSNGVEHQSDQFTLPLKNEMKGQSISFVGSTDTENVYSIEMEELELFLHLQKEKIILRMEKNTISNQKENSNFLTIDSQNKLIKNKKEIFQLNPCEFETIEIAGEGITSFKVSFDESASKYYGFGERYNSINQIGNYLDCFVYNQYRDQGTKTYMPMPYYITDKNYGLNIETDFYTTFDLKRKNKKSVEIMIEVEAENPEVSINLLTGSMKEMISQYIKQTGEPALLPSWAMGPWMSSNNWDRDSVVREQIDLTNELEIPATVIVLEQWSDETTYYMFNDAQYPLLEDGKVHSYEDMTFPEWGRWPNPKALVEHCHDNKLKFILWQIPICKYLNQQKHPLKDQDESFMIENQFVVQTEDGQPYRMPENWFTDSLLMDFTNKEAKKWWFDKRQYLIDIGVDGFKTDGGEMVYGKDVRFSDGSTGSQMRNRYPQSYVDSYYQFAQQNNGMTFSRSGYRGAHKSPAHWAGDERSTFSAFKRQLIAGINSGISGIIFWGWDLAGFNGDIPSAELYMRSSSVAAFCPIMQYHAESKGEFNQDRTPWNIAERTGQKEVIDVYRFFANTRMNLLPYIYSQSIESVNNYEPLMRSLSVEFDDDSFDNCFDQFMFGESLMIAPIIEEGETKREIQLPSGTWIDFWSNKKFSGNQTIQVESQTSEIPVYVRENSVVLLNLGKDKQIGSNISNDIDSYCNLKILITSSKSFTKQVQDHLGNEFIVTVHYELNQVNIEVNNQITYDVELILV
ncbi:glycoside hydrolase family 31 protein [Vagococcus fluvialis]|uniref:glycoside hydrolase family 31 protein n=1 Tax=Vagococcus fluvialis TaxID=2738 RepID=UPI0037892800